MGKRDILHESVHLVDQDQDVEVHVVVVVVDHVQVDLVEAATTVGSLDICHVTARSQGWAVEVEVEVEARATTVERLDISLVNVRTECRVMIVWTAESVTTAMKLDICPVTVLMQTDARLTELLSSASGAMSWDISLATVQTAAVVVAVVHVEEVVARLTCVATTAMRLDTSHATVQLLRRRRSVDTTWCRPVSTEPSSGHRCVSAGHTSQTRPLLFQRG